MLIFFDCVYIINLPSLTDRRMESRLTADWGFVYGTVLSELGGYLGAMPTRLRGDALGGHLHVDDAY